MSRSVLFTAVALLSLCACREGERGGAGTSAYPSSPAQPGEAALAMQRTITVAGDAEILTAPDQFVVAVGFDIQAKTLEEARDSSQKRAAALLAVAKTIPTCEVQTDQLSLQPRYEGYNEPGGQRLVGYQASRGLTITLHQLGEVEELLFALLAAGANRVDRLTFQSSQLLTKQAEARLLAVEAARAKAEAMAAALGQTIGEPLRIEEASAAGWGPQRTNFSYDNNTTPQESATVATGKVRVHSGVSVVFALQPRR